jgi:flagellar biosynthesis protein FlhG
MHESEKEVTPMVVQHRRKYVKTIAVASGKGGVGKTNVAANLAVALCLLGKQVMIMDADFGLSNIDVLFRVAPKQGILQLLTGGLALQDIVVDGPHGIKILSAGSGVQEIQALDPWQRLKILDAFDAYENDIDVLLIDTAAGLSENAAFLCSAAQETVIVTTPEPTSTADAYTLIKALHTRHQEKKFHVLVNSARNDEEAFEAFRRMSCTSEEFVGISLDYLGFLPFDESVPEAVRTQQPFIDLYPDRAISRSIVTIAKKFLSPSDRIKGTLQFFIGSLLSAPSKRC